VGRRVRGEGAVDYDYVFHGLERDGAATLLRLIRHETARGDQRRGPADSDAAATHFSKVAAEGRRADAQKCRFVRPRIVGAAVDRAAVLRLIRLERSADDIERAGAANRAAEAASDVVAEVDAVEEQLAL